MWYTQDFLRWTISLKQREVENTVWNKVEPKYSGQKKSRWKICMVYAQLFKWLKSNYSWAQWHMRVIPATLGTEAGGPQVRGLPWQFNETFINLAKICLKIRNIKELGTHFSVKAPLQQSVVQKIITISLICEQKEDIGSYPLISSQYSIKQNLRL